MKTAEYIDKVKAERNAAQDRESITRKALRRFMVLHIRQKEGGKVRQDDWDEAINMAQEVLLCEYSVDDYKG